ncbi:30S ribosomal protein S6e [Candidatus Methanomassiliicoccus intestinalis]|jgi:ribosomal protein S6e|uniref:Small ribosomal subunit protein eS6 n=2 Tax=Candidatus Methanomassiliicoccus intestinalis TaxID=1406512 RepID=R9T8X7_METII|nr:30S ribosomal protein S6e [Candidatus Methanomassiliicoccus intestinalis]AGN27099.1 30S ribosomal protein S6e [Candidatus Methanomassiliicoccus intestinalis Issoire-Mx1]TQS80933.1 MAG: 30S ribosomal protein S6 [Candidatus Methanomassiliicoccus intestinalis]TQS83925.1 MAG: 30S ribosomal protein S6 [Candidatus Methanomassiliicoccus intestinalis]
MVEFKAVINDVKTGKSYQMDVSGHHANSLIGKKIGDVVDGIFVSLPGYKLTISGGSDKDGVPMRSDLPGGKRKPILLSDSSGFNAPDKGMRRRKMVRGNTISTDTTQINMIISGIGSKPVEELLGQKEEKQ